jgi:hypothetical protein
LPDTPITAQTRRQARTRSRPVNPQRHSRRTTAGERGHPAPLACSRAITITVTRMGSLTAPRVRSRERVKAVSISLAVPVALCVAALLLILAVPVARADGDPASDVLYTSQVFYPYYSNTPKADLKQLEATIADANKRGYRIRVAVITSPSDLGALSTLWEKPQHYSRFLSIELTYAYQGRLLVVSPKGYGYTDHTKSAPAILALIRGVSIGHGTEGLLQTADKAVRLLAQNAGYRLPAVSAASASRSGSSSDTIAIAITTGALLLIGLSLTRPRWRRPPASAKQRV